MSGPIRADYQQRLLLPPSMDEWVPPDHPARFIGDFVDSLDLEAMGFRVPECRTGRPPFAADLLLKVWLYGYFEGIPSTRKLERACLNYIPLIWLTGMHYPDHNTLWRFWHGNREALRRVFKQGILVASKADLVGVVLHALDGTKIAAQVSKHTAWHKKDLEKALEELDDSIDEVMAQVESAQATEVGECRLPEAMQDVARRREQIKQALAELEEMETDHAHPAEREARMMKCKEGIEFAYNAQAVVDEKSGLIVAADVVNEAHDNNHLEPMLKKVEENQGHTAQQTVADGGYYSPEQLARAEEGKHEVLVSAPAQVRGERKEDGEFHKSRFRYDANKDVFICPLGHELTYEGTKPGRHKKDDKLRVYRCHFYRDCPVRSQCSRQKGGRTIEKGPYYESVMRQLEKQQDEGKQKLLKRRKEIVEIVFAWIKQHLGFRRWTVRGLENVRTQWAMLCATLNLRKLYKLWLKEEFAWA